MPLRLGLISAYCLTLTALQIYIFDTFTPVGSGKYVWIAGILTFLSITPWFFTRAKNKIADLLVAFQLLATGLLITDKIYYAQFSDLPAITLIKQWHELITVRDSVYSGFTLRDLALVLAAILWWPVRFLPLLPGSKRSAMGLSVGALGLLTVVVHKTNLPAQTYLGSSWEARELGLVAYHLEDASSFFLQWVRATRQRPEAMGGVRKWTENLAAPRAGSATRPGANVLIIQVESLQNFVVDLKVKGEAIAPHLSEFSRESVYFTDFYSQAGQGGTADADFLAQCSLYPLRKGTAYVEFGTNYFRCLPNRLRSLGYDTAVVHPLRPDFYNLRKAYRSLEIGHRFFKSDFVHDETIGFAISDRSLYRQSAEKIKNLKPPWYVFVVTMTSHTPFLNPGLPRVLDLGELKNTKLGNYLESIHYADAAFGEFIEQLKSAGQLDNTIVVVYGDHTGVHRGNSTLANFLGHDPNDEPYWHPIEKRVPLFIHFPSGQPRGKNNKVAGQVDIAPTLAALVDRLPEKRFFFGHDLFTSEKSDLYFYDGSALNETWLFLSGDSRPFQRVCYDRTLKSAAPAPSCAALAARAQAELKLSRYLLQNDLVPRQ